MSQAHSGERLERRAFLAGSGVAAVSFAGGAAALSLAGVAAREPARAHGEASQQIPTETQIRDYLRPLLLSRDDVERWLAGKAFPFCKYDPQLGYLHIDRDFREGLDGAICQYRYDRLGARRMVNSADRPCRINTYGDSFTSCEQVSDGETWQEALAAHLGEPVRNYGIGGYSVYQAYLRMLREEQRARLDRARRGPARYIIFNIFDDDHARNLLGWQRFKFGVNRKSPNPTVPHLAVNLEAGRIVERPNPCPTPESVYQLCDLDRAYELFHDDFYLRNRLLRAARLSSRLKYSPVGEGEAPAEPDFAAKTIKTAQQELRPPILQQAVSRGEAVPPTDYDDKSLMKHGLFASTQIVGRVEDFAKRHGKRVLYVLSYSAPTIAKYLEMGTRFDQTLVDYLDKTRLPYVDLMQAHAADAARFKGSVKQALSRYFIGHYNPLGNHFCAFAMKDALVRMLDPKPPAYAR